MPHRPTTAWRRALPRRPDNENCLPWLRGRGSLTARIRARGRFAVRLLHQGLGEPTQDEASLIGLRAGKRAWVREVALSCDGEVLAFAHTVLAWRPRGPLTDWFSALGERSLGWLLFSHPGFARGEMRYRRIDARHPLFSSAVAVIGGAPEALWARRSLFRFKGQAVLVTEVFSPVLCGPEFRGG